LDAELRAARIQSDQAAVLQQRVTQLDAELRAARIQSDQAAVLQQRVTQLDAELRAARQGAEVASAAQARLTQAENEARQWHQQCETAEKLAAGAGQQLVALRNELQSAQVQLMESGRRLQEFQERAASVGEMQDRALLMENELSLLRAKSSATEAEMVAVHAELESSMQERATADQRAQEMQQRALAAEGARAQLDKAFRDAMTEVGALKAALARQPAAAPAGGGAPMSDDAIKRAVQQALGDVKRLLEAVAPFTWGVEQAASYIEAVGASPEKDGHARQLKLLLKVLGRLKDRAETM
jgi:chromosome segregation ATPase